MFMKQGEVRNWKEELGSKVLQRCWEGISGARHPGATEATETALSLSRGWF